MINYRTRVLDAVDRGWSEQLEFLRALIAQRSVLGNTNGAMDVAEPLLGDLGMQVERVTLDVETLREQSGFSPPNWSYDGLYNLVGRLPGAGGGRSLVLNGHLDVVPSTPDDQWTHDPWGGEVEAGLMYGRGAADMKSGVSAMLFAVRAVRQAGVLLAGDVLAQLVIDEECTGNGTLACLASGWVADAGITPEPFGLSMVAAHPGVLWARITVRGRAAHAAAAKGAVNSAEKMFLVLQTLRQLERELNDAMPRHPAFVGVEHPLNFNFGQLHAGDWTSSVPEVCTLDVRFSCFPGEDLDEVQRGFAERIAAAARADEWLRETPPEVCFYGFRAEGVVYDGNTDIARVVASNHEAVIGAACARVVSTATIDNRFFELHFDIPSVCYGPAGGQLHAPDEWVDLESVLKCTKVLASSLVDWCGAE
ncbi:MAG: ArgE/DapE family deacylase [Actinomycetota bacterium]|nr:ArgE/DapE family deacylase [Actinomycetota bacterium]